MSAIVQPDTRIDLLERAKLLPYMQGDLDQFCALFSIINGIRLAHHGNTGPSYPTEAKLFGQGLRYIAENTQIEDVVVNGMDVPLWQSLARHLCKRATESGFRTEITIAPSATMQSTSARLRWICHALSNGSPVLILLEGIYQHYSVVHGITPKRILLFDSWGFKWIHLTSTAEPGRRGLSSATAMLRLTAPPNN